MKRTLITLALVVAAAVCVGCGDGVDDADTQTPTPTPTIEATPTPTPTPGDITVCVPDGRMTLLVGELRSLARTCCSTGQPWSARQVAARPAIGYEIACPAEAA